MAIASPIPLEAPVMKIVYPLRLPSSDFVKSNGTKVLRVHIGIRVEEKWLLRLLSRWFISFVL